VSCCIVASLTVGLGSGGARETASPPRVPQVPGSATPAPGVDAIIVGFERASKASARASLVESLGHETADTLDLPKAGIQARLIELPDGESAAEAIARYERNPLVAYAEPNGRWGTLATPNDSRFSELWGLHNTGQSVYKGPTGTADADIDAPEAWDLTTGSPNVVVAVVDTGVHYGHPDLAPNIWTNPGETGGGRESNGVDDDANGYVDDWRGWDWTSGDEFVPGSGDNDPLDLNGHGTHVAGTIGARGNDGQGVAGVTWKTKLMALRVLDTDGFGEFWGIAKAFAYASRNGAHVVNASLGGFEFSQAVSDAVENAPSTLFVFAAGNNANDNDDFPTYPCSEPHANIVCVASSTSSDDMSSFSNFGATSVDLAAPGSSVLSTYFPLVFVDELDANDDRWSYSGTPNTWDWVSAGAEGGHIEDSPGAPYVNDTNSLATLNETLDLSGSSGCWLTYSLRQDLELFFDFLIPEISTDGGTTWEEVHTGWTGSTDGDWFPLADDIGEWDGEANVRVRFRLLTDEIVTGAGADLDDVGVHCVTSPGRPYDHAYFDGTSMATPHVAGAAALLKARRPLATPAHIKTALLAGVDAKPSFAGNTVTGGRLNLHTSLQILKTVPDAPSGVAMRTNGSNSAIVSWAPPASDGGSPVTGYVVTPFVDGVPQSSTSVGTVTETQIAPLNLDTAYTFTVRARNALGDGPASAPSSAGKLVIWPWVPTEVIAVAGNARATITWSPPLYDGGSPVTGYVVTTLGPSRGSPIRLGLVNRTVVTGLANGAKYRFTVAATNAIGIGPAEFSHEVTPRAPAVASAARLTPRKPRAGRKVVATVAVVADVDPVRPSGVACAGLIGKAKVKGKPGRASGLAKCTFKTPRAAKGKRLKGSVSFTAREKRFTKRFSVKLR
jgi:thermitase